MIYDNNLGDFACSQTREFKQKRVNASIQKEKSLPFNSTSNIYESVLDFELNEDSRVSGFANSNDSGIHSSTNGTYLISQTHNQQENSDNRTIESLYSSVISSKKSMDTLATSRDVSSGLDDKSCSNNGSDDLEEEDYVNVQHLEQHELPLGWVKCCGNFILPTYFIIETKN